MTLDKDWLRLWRNRERLRRRGDKKLMKRMLRSSGSNITTLHPDVDEARATRSLVLAFEEIGAAKDALALRYDTV